MAKVNEIWYYCILLLTVTKKKALTYFFWNFFLLVRLFWNKRESSSYLISRLLACIHWRRGLTFLSPFAAGYDIQREFEYDPNLAGAISLKLPKNPCFSLDSLLSVNYKPNWHWILIHKLNCYNFINDLKLFNGQKNQKMLSATMSIFSFKTVRKCTEAWTTSRDVHM